MPFALGKAAISLCRLMYNQAVLAALLTRLRKKRQDTKLFLAVQRLSHSFRVQGDS